MGISSFLSPHLLTILNSLNISYRFQAKGNCRPGILSYFWKTNDEIGLAAALYLEWDLFCIEPSRSGV
jgi:hypothetical protein